MLRQALLLVGGRGTRLGALTQTTPKPLLPVGNRFFLSYLIENAVRHGLSEIVLLAGYRGEMVEALWGHKSEVALKFAQQGLTLRVVQEPAPAGTAGALTYIKNELDDVFLLANGDSFFDFNWLDLLSIPTDSDWQALVALRGVADCSRYGLVELSGSRIIKFRSSGPAAPGVINGGVYILRRSLLNLVSHTPCSLEHEIFPELAKIGAMYGRAYDRFFIDIGIPDDYARADELMPQVSRRPALFET